MRLYVVEEQEIYRELYKNVFPSDGQTELLRVVPMNGIGVALSGVIELGPDVLLLSVKGLNKQIIEEISEIRSANPHCGIVLLLTHYTTKDVESLRRMTLFGSGGLALFLKQSLDVTEQLRSIIEMVSMGQVILDPLLSAHLLSEKPECQFLKEMTSRELEILGLLAKGYTNQRIADCLYIDVKTVEHHVNNVYSKIKSGEDFSAKHPRVEAVRLYLEAIGELMPSPKLQTNIPVGGIY